MTLPVARMLDLSTVDPCGAPPRPNTEGSGNVFVNNIPVHLMGMLWAKHACPGSSPHPSPPFVFDSTVSGSSSVFVNGIPLARMTDPISCGSVIGAGSGNVFAGG